jgi:TetR/AcrR family transcriptional regulator, tetracycline repressor protein
MAYDMNRIARVALDLLADVGLDGLTTRRLAAELGVEGPALYHHFENKGELLGYMATAIMRESLGMIVDHGDWKRWIFDHTVTTRLILLRYRDSARILATSAPTRAMRREIVPAIIRPLIDSGFKQIDAIEMFSMMAAFTLGFVINEQNKALRSMMTSSMSDLDRGFLHGVEALIAGAEQKYGSHLKQKRGRS